MKTFELSGTVTISITTKVEAETEAEAIEIAAQRDMPHLCHSCSSSHGRSKHWVTSGEIDGDPANIEVMK